MLVVQPTLMNPHNPYLFKFQRGLPHLPRALLHEAPSPRLQAVPLLLRHPVHPGEVKVSVQVRAMQEEEEDKEGAEVTQVTQLLRLRNF